MEQFVVVIIASDKCLMVDKLIVTRSKSVGKHYGKIQCNLEIYKYVRVVEEQNPRGDWQ